MTSRAATIDAGGPAAAEALPEAREVVAPVRGGAMKFAFASGSRPLEGYTLKRGIGRGGFGEVYFATSDAGKEVAVKHIERNLEVELRGVGQCLNLKHPNLIDLYDIRYDEQGDAWVVMEYVAGQSLKDTIDRNPNGLPLDQVNFWFKGIAAGVSYLHDHGIVHRDLKPGNIFEDTNFVKIGDYGLSKFISCSRRSGQTESVGTFHYMAPEIGKGVYGKEIDIYALGVALYEMLTGRVPFDGESSQEIIMKHLTAEPDLAGVPQPYRTIIERALQKDPEKRYHNATEMLAALSAPVAGTKLGPGAPLVRPVPADDPIEYRLAEPLYIGDENEGIEFGELHEDPSKAIVNAEIVGRGGARTPAPEPVARAAGTGWRRLRQWWDHGPMTTTVKIGLLVVAAVIAAIHGGWLLVAAVAAGSVYLVYRGFRLLVAALGRRAHATPAVAGAAPAHIPRGDAVSGLRGGGWHPLRWEQDGRQLLREKTAGDRVGELTGSMLGAALIAGVLTVVMTAIGAESLDNSTNSLAGPVWLWLMTTAGAWLVLGAGKFWEGSPGEAVKRRFLMLVLGLSLGAIGFLSSQYLMVRMDNQAVRGMGILRDSFDSSSSLPKLPAFLGYFGALFLTIGWWKQTDPLRSSRLRIGPILITVLFAWLWLFAFPFPQPWGFMLVAAISIAVQLSAPWLSPNQRNAALGR
jgi:protein kinase-like protein